MRKLNLFLRDKRFVYGVFVFLLVVGFYVIFQNFYKPLIVFSDSVNFRFGLVKQNFSPDEIMQYQYISFIYDYNKDPARLKLERAQGKTFIKRVICMEGQRLSVDLKKREFYCDGVLIGKGRDKFLNGDRASLFVYNGKIPKGYVFVEGDTKYSFDSRYWGFVKKEEITGIVIPLF